MSQSLTQIQEAEKKAAKIKAAAEEKTHRIIVDAEEKSHQDSRKHKESLHEKQRASLMKHKEICAEKLEKTEKQMTASLMSSKKKWEGNVQKGADFLVKSFVEYFS